MSYLLEAKSISFSYSGNKTPVLDGLDLNISSGELVALIGPNGSGKTTLAMILSGMFEPDSGEVLLDGSEIYDESYIPRAGEVGFLYQNPSDGILTTSVEREIAFGMENACVPSGEIRRRVDRFAAAFGLEDALKRSVEQLSGGNIERCALAAAMATEPKLLILDEPDSFLDFEGKLRFWRMVEDLEASGTAIFYITQSIAGASRADRKYYIKNGILVEYNNIQNNKITPITSTNISNDRSYRFANIHFSYNKNEILHGIDIEIKGGERVALLGPSGSGKTTLARVCAGLFQSNSGKIFLPDKKNRRDGIPIALSFQFPEKQLFAETVLEDVAFGPKNLGLTKPKAIAIRALERVGIDEMGFVARSPFELSGGQQRWVGLAGVLACEPDCIFFDEPTGALDPNGKELFRDLIAELAEDDIAIFIITHDLELASACAERAIVLRDGEVAFEGSMTCLMNDRKLRSSLGLGTEEDLLEET
jgi:energy-coupling factor transport system ATP-binding protein